MAKRRNKKRCKRIRDYVSAERQREDLFRFLNITQKRRNLLKVSKWPLRLSFFH